MYMMDEVRQPGLINGKIKAPRPIYYESMLKSYFQQKVGHVTLLPSILESSMVITLDYMKQLEQLLELIIGKLV
jgi:hypothetical protein